MMLENILSSTDMNPNQKSPFSVVYWINYAYTYTNQKSIENEDVK